MRPSSVSQAAMSTMIANSDSTLEAFWDLRQERPTLGGAIVLRQEAELLSKAGAAVKLSIAARTFDSEAVRHLVKQVFGSSQTIFEPVRGVGGRDAWPPHSLRSDNGFRYYSLSRLIQIYAESGRVPRLKWSKNITRQALDNRHRFPGTLVAAHLKRISPFAPEESNANGAEWARFLQHECATRAVTFLLLGDDELPAGVQMTGRVLRASDCGFSLADQLAIIGKCDAFIGMASGLSTTALFTDIPCVLFKHPHHHARAMQQEFGDIDRLPFCREDQNLRRAAASSGALSRELGKLLDGAQ